MTKKIFTFIMAIIISITNLQMASASEESDYFKAIKAVMEGEQAGDQIARKILEKFNYICIDTIYVTDCDYLRAQEGSDTITDLEKLTAIVKHNILLTDYYNGIASNYESHFGKYVPNHLKLIATRAQVVKKISEVVLGLIPHMNPSVNEEELRLMKRDFEFYKGTALVDKELKIMKKLNEIEESSED